MSTALLINHSCSSLFNFVLLVTIIYVTYRNVVEYRKTKEKNKKLLLFVFGVLLNITAFTCLSVNFFKSYSQVINAERAGTNPLWFACNMVYLNHTFLIMVLFVRVYYIFRGTDLQVSTRTIILFIFGLLCSSSIFLVIVTTPIHIPGTDTWVNCAITLCIFNVIFMTAITSLFLSKLSIVFRRASQSKSAQNRRDTALVHIITKTTLLSLITMMITFFSCILLLFRFSIFGDNQVVSLISDWVISLDIYSNFLCYSLSFKYFHRYYAKFCRACDIKCKNIWYYAMFGAAVKDLAFLNEGIASHLSTANMLRTASTNPSNLSMQTVSGSKNSSFPEISQEPTSFEQSKETKTEKVGSSGEEMA